MNERCLVRLRVYVLERGAAAFRAAYKALMDVSDVHLMDICLNQLVPAIEKRLRLP